MVRVEPGAFRPYIRLWFAIGSQADVAGFRLNFDRYWLDDIATGANCGAEVAACLAETLQLADPMFVDVAAAFMAWRDRAGEIGTGRRPTAAP